MIRIQDNGYPSTWKTKIQQDTKVLQNSWVVGPELFNLPTYQKRNLRLVRNSNNTQIEDFKSVWIMKTPSQELISFFMVFIAFKNTFCCCCFKQKENMTFSPHRLGLCFSLSTEHSISCWRHLLPAKLNLAPCCALHMTRFTPSVQALPCFPKPRWHKVRRKGSTRIYSFL